VTPYYNKPSQEGLYQHFKVVSEHSPLPIILYNIAGRTGVNMTAETTLRIAADFPHVIGIEITPSPPRRITSTAIPSSPDRTRNPSRRRSMIS